MTSNNDGLNPGPANVSVNLALFKVLLDTKDVQAEFCARLSDRSRVCHNDALEILRRVPFNGTGNAFLKILSQSNEAFNEYCFS